MTNDQSSPNDQNSKKYDLDERTTKFGLAIIDFSIKIPENTITRPMISQLVRSGTSIGANYAEADEASSKKDFVNKISIAKKETKETKYWLTMVAHIAPSLKDEARVLWKEAQELNLIFAAVIRNSKNSSNGH